MMGGYTTYSSIAAVMAQTIFLPHTCTAGTWCWRFWCLLVGGLVAAASGMLVGRMLAARLMHVLPNEEPGTEHEEGR